MHCLMLQWKSVISVTESMNTSVHLSFLDKIYHFFSRRIVRHSLLWIVLYAVFVTLHFLKNGSFADALISETINISLYIAIVYFNLNYLIPRYLTQRTFATYCILLIFAAIALTPIKTVIFYFLYANKPLNQEYLIFNMGYIFLSMFMIACFSTIIQVMTDWLRHRQEKKELETKTMQSELNFLKSQINPHFLFNTLNSLYALTLKKSEKAPEIVIQLSEIMRYMLYECNERRVPLRKEVNYMKNYIELERLRQGSDVDLQFTVKGEIGDQKIAPLMFIPFIENSFKHGLSNQIKHGFVHICLELVDGVIKLHIQNSKTPAQPLQEHKRSGGIGLVNIQRRLDLIYPERYTLEIRDQPDRYIINLSIELDDQS